MSKVKNPKLAKQGKLSHEWARSHMQILDNTISLHRKKLTNSLYTINALNELIRTVNNGVLDTTFQVEWENYRNCILTTTEDGLKRINTEVDEIIHIKVKR